MNEPVAPPVDNKQNLGKKEALAFIEDTKPELLVTMGAGDIDRLVDPITKILSA